MACYVYYSYEPWGRGYIGSRTKESQLAPEDDQYFGSFSDKTFKPTEKIVLGVFPTAQEAIQAEIMLHDFFDVVSNPHFANRSRQTSTSFSTTGLKRDEDFSEICRQRMTGRVVSESNRRALRERMLTRNPMKNPLIAKKSKEVRRSYEGEGNPKCKLSKEDCLQIRSYKESGLYTNPKLAEIFNVSLSTIKRVLRPNHWSLS